MSRYRGTVLTTEEIEELDACEATIQKLNIDGLVPTAKAFLAIRDKGLWRLADPSLEKYLRRRWNYTLKGMTYILIRAAVDDRKAIGKQALPQRNNQDVDYAAEAMSASLVKGANVVEFNIDAAVGLLRETREIVVSSIMVQNEGRLDFVTWLERLKALATDLIDLQGPPRHARSRDGATGTEDASHPSDA